MDSYGNEIVWTEILTVRVIMNSDPQLSFFQCFKTVCFFFNSCEFVCACVYGAGGSNRDKDRQTDGARDGRRELLFG